MSSFSFNIASAKPIVRETASMNNDGGGGNLGYMQQNREQNEEKHTQFDASIFGKHEDDIFQLSKDVEPEMAEDSLLETVIKNIKKLVKKILIVFVNGYKY